MTRIFPVRSAFRAFAVTLLAALSATPVLAAPEPEQRMIDRRFGNNGRFVVPFDSGGTWRDDGYAAVEQSDGRLVVAGVVELGGGRTGIGVARLTRAGGLDAGFGGNGTGRNVIDAGGSNSIGAYAAAVQGDNKIVVAGWITGPAHQGENFLAMRFEANGALDTTFGLAGRAAIAFDLGGNMNDWAQGVAIQGDGKIVVVGNVQRFGSEDRDIGVVRLNPSGGADTGFGNSGKVVAVIDRGGNNDARATGVALQGDGKIAIGGWASTASNGTDVIALRLLATGAIDSGFGSSGVAQFNLPGTRSCLDDEALTIRAVSWTRLFPSPATERRLLLAGSTCVINTGGNDDWDGLLVRLNDNGSLDTSLNDGLGHRRLAFDLGGFNRDLLTGVEAVNIGGLLPGLFPPGHLVLSGTAYDSREPGDRGNQMVVRMIDWNGTTAPSFGAAGTGYIDFDLGGGNYDWSNGMILTRRLEAVLVGTAERVSAGDMDFAVSRIILDRIFAGSQESN